MDCGSTRMWHNFYLFTILVLSSTVTVDLELYWYWGALGDFFFGGRITEVRIRGRHFWTGDLSSFSTRPVSLRRFILNALPSCLPISNNHSICASLRNCLMWILRRPILGLDYYSPFSPWSFPIQFITKILQVWLCRTQFHLHSIWQWFLTLALSDRLHCFSF